MIVKNQAELFQEEYHKDASLFDEMWADKESIRPHWKALLDEISKMGIEELSYRHQELQRLLRENGVTYNVYGDPQGMNRPWKLDPIPLVLSQSAWSELERGLKQRAELLNAMLNDLYGKRMLIREGLIPKDLIFSDKKFLRPCDQIQYPHPYQLLMYAADISRGPDGRMWIIGDKTQAPSGWGYTMENRSVMARVLPEFFQANPIYKMSGYFRQTQNAITQFAPIAKDDTRVVLLTPGPMNETYFEHAYLASFQGLTLVQGQDLMVKDDFVWLKTLSGLEKVDIIIRRVDDVFCDPLSLRMDSQLGVAGLLEVVRKGNVTISNALGSGILENPGLMAFMPTVCQRLLGEEQILPNIATWWCGQKTEFTFVMERLDQLVIKCLDKRLSPSSQLGWLLSKEELDNLKRKIKAFPYLYVGQEQAIFSSSPSFSSNILSARHTVLRCFLNATLEGYEVLPGGLTRSAPEEGNNHVSNQAGGISKDTWVLNNDHHRPSHRINLNSNVPPRLKGMEELPSRTAENLFWVGRYGIRILYTARLMRIVMEYQASVRNFTDFMDEEILNVLLGTLTQMTMTYPGFLGDEGITNLKNPEPELKSIMLDPHRVGGLAFSLERWKGAANSVRDRWSMDTWRVLDSVDLSWKKLISNPKVEIWQVRAALDQLINGIAALIGLTRGSMSGEEGRIVYDIGMDIEKCLLISSLIRSTLVAEREDHIEYSLLEAVLRINESLHSYRYRYRTFLQLSGTLELILLDTSYPQSMAFAVQDLQERLSTLPEINITGKLREEEKLILKIFTNLQLVNALQLTKVSKDSVLRDSLDQLLSKVSDSISESASIITHTYFSHIRDNRQLTVFSLDQEI